MARDQKVLKLFIRLMLPVFALGSIASLILPSLVWEKTVAMVESPKHSYRVEVVRLKVHRFAASGEACKFAFNTMLQFSSWAKTSHFAL